MNQGLSCGELKSAYLDDCIHTLSPREEHGAEIFGIFVTPGQVKSGVIYGRFAFSSMHRIKFFFGLLRLK